MHPQNTAQFLYQAITSEFQTINISTPYLSGLFHLLKDKMI